MKKLSGCSVSLIAKFFTASFLLPCAWGACVEAEENPFDCVAPSENAIVSMQAREDAKDKSVPIPVELSWKMTGESAGLTFDVYLSKNDKFTEADILYANTAETHVPAFNLEIGVTYSWQVLAKKAGEKVAQSPVWHFQTPPAPPRWLEIDGMTNVRDIGAWTTRDGYKIKQGLIFRGSAPNTWNKTLITEKGINTFVNSLKIKTDLDLREDGKSALDPSKINWIKAPVNAYFGIIQFGALGWDGYRKVFQVLAKQENYPIYFHCQAGADRAGTVSFLLGALLNMRLDDLTRDYEFTSCSLSGTRDQKSAGFRSLLEALDSFGSPDDSLQFKAYSYLRYTGVSEEELKSIYEILTGKELKLCKMAKEPEPLVPTPIAVKEYSIPQTRNVIKLDGDFSDWNEKLSIDFPSQDTLPPEGKWQGNNDCSGQLFLCWDEKNLYIGVKVLDDVFKNEKTGSDIWNGDAIQIAIGGLKGKISYDYELGFALTKNGPQVFSWIAANKEYGGLRNEIPVLIKREALLTSYEIAIPLTYLGISGPGDGVSLRLNCVVLDDDTGKGQNKHITLTPGLLGGKRASQFNEFILRGISLKQKVTE